MKHHGPLRPTSPLTLLGSAALALLSITRGRDAVESDVLEGIRGRGCICSGCQDRVRGRRVHSFIQLRSSNAQPASSRSYVCCFIVRFNVRESMLTEEAGTVLKVSWSNKSELKMKNMVYEGRSCSSGSSVSISGGVKVQWL